MTRHGSLIKVLIWMRVGGVFWSTWSVWGHTALPVAVWTRLQSTQTQVQGRQADHPAVSTLVVLTWK